jgi:hypothetical protein
MMLPITEPAPAVGFLTTVRPKGHSEYPASLNIKTPVQQPCLSNLGLASDDPGNADGAAQVHLTELVQLGTRSAVLRHDATFVVVGGICSKDASRFASDSLSSACAAVIPTTLGTVPAT